jgi:hypothetical protein
MRTTGCARSTAMAVLGVNGSAARQVCPAPSVLNTPRLTPSSLLRKMPRELPMNIVPGTPAFSVGRFQCAGKSCCYYDARETVSGRGAGRPSR